MQRKTLREARLARGYSQEKLAHLCGLGRGGTISEWECCASNPTPGNQSEVANVLEWQGTLETLFEITEDDQTHLEEHTEEEQRIMVVVSENLQAFLTYNLTNHLLTIAHTDYSTPHQMTAALRAAIEESNAMNIDDLTRREALRTLAALPMTTLGMNPVLSSKHYDEMLRHATAALEACWQLYRSSDPIGTQHAFDCCCTYVPMLESIAHNSEHRQKKAALDLAARYAIVQTLLSWECVKPWEAVRFAQKALDLSKASGNILLQLSAYPKLSRTYIRSRAYTEAWKAMQEGEHLLKRYLKSKKQGPPPPSGIIGNFYSSYCQAQVKNGMVPDTALSILVDSEPLDKSMAFVQFDESNQWWEAAWIYNAKGDPMQTMHWLDKLIDLETLAVQPHASLSASGSARIGAINMLTNALLQSPERDLEKIIKTWQTGMEGSQMLRHEMEYQEAIANFEIMKALYPGEQAIFKLTPLTSHW